MARDLAVATQPRPLVHRANPSTLSRERDPRKSEVSFFSRVAPTLGQRPGPGASRKRLAPFNHWNSCRLIHGYQWPKFVGARCERVEGSLSCFHVDHPHKFPFVHFIRHLWDTTNMCGDTISNYVSLVRTRLALHSMTPIPECRFASELLVTLRAQPRVRAYRDPAPASLVAAVLSDENTDLAVRAVVVCLWYATLRAGSLVGDNVFSFDEEYTLLRKDVVFHEGWVGFRIRTFKTDKQNKGAVIWIQPTGKPGCPVTLFLRFWHSTSHFEATSPLFRRAKDGGAVTKRSVAYVLKTHARALGIPDTYISSHSLRVGSASHLAAAEISLSDIMFQGRWAQSESVLKYLRDALPRAQRILRALDLESCFDSSGLPSAPPRLPPTVFHQRATSSATPAWRS